MSPLGVEYLQHLGLSLLFMLLVLSVIAISAWKIHVHWDGKYYPYLTYHDKVYRWDVALNRWCVSEGICKQGGQPCKSK
ncbi:unnamed protein product [marine sediment metagenome]|uniref:Uncharacterized protein n=1 Tax=marine sediment metagenome TaxID=412755 RepID=X0TSR0_9ZZZZ